MSRDVVKGWASLDEAQCFFQEMLRAFRISNHTHDILLSFIGLKAYCDLRYSTQAYEQQNMFSPILALDELLSNGLSSLISPTASCEILHALIMTLPVEEKNTFLMFLQPEDAPRLVIPDALRGALDIYVDSRIRGLQDHITAFTRAAVETQSSLNELCTYFNRKLLHNAVDESNNSDIGSIDESAQHLESSAISVTEGE